MRRRKEGGGRQGGDVKKEESKRWKRAGERARGGRSGGMPEGEQVQTWPVRKSLTARGQKLPEGLVCVPEAKPAQGEISV